MKRIILMAALLAAACDDEPVGPDVCAQPRACEVEGGADLAIVAVTADSVVQRGFNTHVLDVNDVAVNVVIVNRGDRASSSANVEVSAFGERGTARVLALDPGDSAVVRVPVDIERELLYGGKESDAQNISAEVITSDVDAGNNRMSSGLYALNIPHVTIHPLPDTLQTVVLDKSTIAVRWRSTTGFASGVTPNGRVTVLVCLQARGQTCASGGWEAVTRLNAFFSSTQSGVVAFVSARNVGVPAAGLYDIAVCVVPSSHTALQIIRNHPDHHCETGGQVRVVNN